jgi:CSLREA domain-containing protein/uncharacterized repeat protein (TIGR01451 family)
VCALASVTGSAAAAAFTVNTTGDPVGGSCPGTCSLRAAVVAADRAGGASTITIPGGTFTLSVPSTSSSPLDDPATGDLDIDSGAAVTIDGAGPAATVIDANHLDRAFAVHQGASLTINGVTVEHGNSSGPGSGSNGNSTSPGNGGAIYNAGSLQLIHTVLSGNYAQTGGGAIFADTGASSTLLTNSTVSNNAAADGGGLAVGAGAVGLNSDTLVDNTASGGGGFMDESLPVGSPAVTITGSTVEGNSAGGPGGGFLFDGAGSISITSSSISNDSTSFDQAGGGLYVANGGRLTVASSNFTDDTAGDQPGGGAIYALANDLTIGSSNFRDNSGGIGGAVYVDGSSPTASQAISSSAFTANHAHHSDGGAVDVARGALTIASSTFSENLSAQYGGALSYESGGALSLVNDTFDSNQAADGGAIGLLKGPTSGRISLLNDTIARNSAIAGGGLYQANLASANAIENTIIAGNTGESDPTHGGGDCYDTTGFGAGAADGGHNLDGDGSCFAQPGMPSLALAPGDQPAADPMLAPLADNGGQVSTDALLPGSPAIGRANAIACPASDARGVGRPAGACDLGAFQSAAADVALAASSPARAAVGAPITDTFTITDNGPGSATGVSFSASLPSGAMYFGATTSQGNCSGTTSITCEIGTIGSSQTGGTGTVSVTLVWIASVSGTLTASARVTAAESDPNPGNNAAGATTRVAAAGGSPLLLTGPATLLGRRSATLTGLIDPVIDGTTRYHFALGRTKRYGINTAAHKLTGRARTRLVKVRVAGLAPGTLYHYHLVAQNSAGTSRGQDQTFRTPRR